MDDQEQPDDQRRRARRERARAVVNNPADPGIDFGFGDKIAPRLGFAYDVKGDSKWKTYGSFGRYYDITKLEMPRGSFGADHRITYYYTLDTFNWPSITCTPGPTGCPGTFITEVDLRHAANQRPAPDGTSAGSRTPSIPTSSRCRPVS